MCMLQFYKSSYILDLLGEFGIKAYLVTYK